MNGLQEGLLFFFALLLYSVAIWSEHEGFRSDKFIVITFASALVFDTVGTVVVCALKAESWVPGKHGVIGYLAWFIMAGHFIWLIRAFRGGLSQRLKFHKWAVRAWTVWLLAFGSGLFV